MGRDVTVTAATKNQNQIPQVFRLKAAEPSASGISAQAPAQDLFPTSEAPRSQEQTGLIMSTETLSEIGCTRQPTKANQTNLHLPAATPRDKLSPRRSPTAAFTLLLMFKRKRKVEAQAEFHFSSGHRLKTPALSFTCLVRAVTFIVKIPITQKFMFN